MNIRPADVEVIALRNLIDLDPGLSAARQHLLPRRIDAVHGLSRVAVVALCARNIDLADRAFEMNSVLLRVQHIVVALIARLCPEVLKVGRISCLDARNEHGKRAVVELSSRLRCPRLHRDALIRQLMESRLLRLIEALVRIAEPAAVDSVHDLRKCISKEPLALHMHRNRTRKRDRRADDIRAGAVPAVRVLDAGHRLVAAAAAVHIAVRLLLRLVVRHRECLRVHRNRRARLVHQ